MHSIQDILTLNDGRYSYVNFFPVLRQRVSGIYHAFDLLFSFTSFIVYTIIRRNEKNSDKQNFVINETKILDAIRKLVYAPCNNDDKIDVTAYCTTYGRQRMAEFKYNRSIYQFFTFGMYILVITVIKMRSKKLSYG